MDGSAETWHATCETCAEAMMNPSSGQGPDVSKSPAQRWAVLILIGAIGGLLSGLFAVGGGVIMVPLLVALARFDMRRAAATSLAAIVPAAVGGSVTYLLHGEIDLVAGAFVSVGAVFGAMIGSALLKRIPLLWLRWIFIAFVVLVALRMFVVVPVRGATFPFTPAVAAAYVGLGLVVGIASGVLGVGGGILFVPALVALFASSDLVAKGTSLLIMIPTSVVGTFSNWRAGTVDVRAGLVVGIAAALASIPGSALAIALPPRVSAILFGSLLLVVAGQLTAKALAASRTPRSPASPSGR